MTRDPKIIAGMSSGFMLCLNLATAVTEAAAPCVDKKTGPSSIVCGAERRNGIDTIKGEVLGIEGPDYVVRQFYGKEVRLMTDEASHVTGRIAPGDSIEANVREVDNQKRVLSISPIK